MSADDEGLPIVPGGSPGAYPLHDLVRPVGSRSVPLAFERAAALDARARSAYAAAAYGRAADLFMAVAAALIGDAARPYAATLRTDRLLAYQNAAAAWAMADANATATNSLRAAATADPDCAEAIEDLVQRLPAPVPRGR